MPHFSIITTAVTSLTIQSVLMECTVYRTVYPKYGFVPHTIVIIVLCRDIWSEVPKVLLLVYVRASELRAIFRGSPALENYVAQKKNSLNRSAIFD